MEKLIDNINNTKDLKKLSYNKKYQLSDEIRKYIIEVVSENGGHLASNLGVVELTIALHSVFNLPKDKIVWDVGHQTYVHKILTGRKEKLKTLRQLNGIAGFPKVEENEADCFNTGHSSTSISVALGMAKARDIKNEKYSCIAVIGDGALTGGMALEALNDAGSSKTNLIVILNDNEMSISKNVGGIAMFLNKVRTRKFYTKSNNYVKKIVQKIPYIGNKIIHIVRKIKYSLKQLLIPNMMFEDMGFRYIGPVNGHDIEKMESILKIAKNLEGPILIHVVTKKGKGYKPAEENPDKFHATSSFNIKDGTPKKEKTKDYSKAFGDKLIELAKKNKRIVAINASMKDGTGLSKFSKEFPERFFDAGIAEQHALGMAAGMAKNGLIPVVPIYSTFYQRAYDQVIHDVCLQKLPVIMCVDRAGIVGNDGETHQGIYDLSFFNIVPNLEILAPKDFKELEKMMEYAVKAEKPILIRYPRGGEAKIKFDEPKNIRTGKAEIIKNGENISIIAIGKMVARAVEVADILKEEGINAEVINARFLKPLDEETITNSITKTKVVITIEDNIIEGALGTKIEELIVEKNIQAKIRKFGYPDKFIKHGTPQELEKIYGLDAENIAKNCAKILEKNLYV